MHSVLRSLLLLAFAVFPTSNVIESKYQRNFEIFFSIECSHMLHLSSSSTQTYTVAFDEDSVQAKSVTENTSKLDQSFGADGFDVDGMERSNITLGMWPDQNPFLRGVKNGSNIVEFLIVLFVIAGFIISIPIICWKYFEILRKRFSFYIFSNKF